MNRQYAIPRQRHPWTWNQHTNWCQATHEPEALLWLPCEDDEVAVAPAEPEALELAPLTTAVDSAAPVPEAEAEAESVELDDSVELSDDDVPHTPCSWVRTVVPYSAVKLPAATAQSTQLSTSAQAEVWKR